MTARRCSLPVRILTRLPQYSGTWFGRPALPHCPSSLTGMVRMVHCARAARSRVSDQGETPLGPIDYFSTTLGSAFGRAVEPSPDPVGAIVALLWHGTLLVVAGAESSLRCRVAPARSFVAP